jgi:serine/threonine protein phosphatase 1
MIGRLFSTLAARRAGSAAPGADLFQPEIPICVIGDLHGRLDLLEAMLALAGEQPDAEAVRLVFVGDMIDRGPDSAGVLRRLHGLCTAVPERVICLCGNHERMFLDFLADPPGQGRRWLDAGGGETLSSFGLGQRVAGETPAARFEALAQALRAALPPARLAWLAGLPLVWQEGNLAVSHAGADPALALADQPPRALLWGHPGFARHPRRDGLWIAHGHVILPAPEAREGRISVDTGAWRTGRLSAAWIDAGGLRFLEARV